MPDAVGALSTRLHRLAGGIAADGDRATRAAQVTIARRWSGLAAIEARAALADQHRLVGVASAAVGDAAAALVPVGTAASAALTAIESARRVAVDLGVELDVASDGTVFVLRARPDAGDPGLAEAGVRALRQALATVRARIDAADRACARRLDEIADLAHGLVAFPVRPAVTLWPALFTPPFAPEPGLLAAAPALGALARPPTAGWIRASPLGAAVLTPGREAADLSAPPLVRQVAGRAALFDAATGPRPSAGATAASLLRPAADGAPRRVLEWDPAGGHLAEVAGNLATAERVIVLVPGTNTSLGHWSSIAADVTHLYDAVRARAGADRVAVIGWYGADEPPNLAAAVLQSYAKRAAPRLADFVRGLGLHPGVRLTLVGHSYGGTVAGLAVHEGLRPAALVGVAAPGFGPRVDSATDLGGVPTFVLTHPADPITDVQPLQRLLIGFLSGPLGARAVDRLTGAAGLGHLGIDPIRLPGAIRLSTGDDRARRPLVATDVAMHSDYFDPGSLPLRQIASVADGVPAVPYRR